MNRYHAISGDALLASYQYNCINDGNRFELKSDFYFQQRNGRIDLDYFNNIDIKTLIKDVNIDILQQSLHNIILIDFNEKDLRHMTDIGIIKLFRMSQFVVEYLLYLQELIVLNLSAISNKYLLKRNAIYRKRQELSNLKESCIHYKNEIKVKKSNLETIETLLFKSHKISFRIDRDSTKPVTVCNNVHVTSSVKSIEKIQLYVCRSDGLFIVTSCSQTLKIEYLLNDIIDLFTSQCNAAKPLNILDRQRHCLIYKGKVLTKESSVESNMIVSGDTLILKMINNISCDNETKSTAINENKHTGLSDEMLAEISKANQINEQCIRSELNKQECIISEVSLKLKNILTAFSSFETSHNSANAQNNAYKDAFSNLINELNNLNLKNACKIDDFKLQQMVPRGSGMAFGDLESDDDSGMKEVIAQSIPTLSIPIDIMQETANDNPRVLYEIKDLKQEENSINSVALVIDKVPVSEYEEMFDQSVQYFNMDDSMLKSCDLKDNSALNNDASYTDNLFNSSFTIAHNVNGIHDGIHSMRINTFNPLDPITAVATSSIAECNIQTPISIKENVVLRSLYSAGASPFNIFIQNSNECNDDSLELSKSHNDTSNC